MGTLIGEIITFGNGKNGSSVAQSFIELSAEWEGTGPYTQSCTATGYTITPYSKIDLQPDAMVLQQLMEDGVRCMYIENDNTALTCYAIGGAPTSSIAIQCTITEISSDTSIIDSVPAAEGMSF